MTSTGTTTQPTAPGTGMRPTATAKRVVKPPRFPRRAAIARAAEREGRQRPWLRSPYDY